MTSRGGCVEEGCEGGCKGHKRRDCSVSVPSHSSSAFSRSSSNSCSYSSIRFKSRKKTRVYYLKAQLLPQNCRCIGTTAQCPYIVVPSFATVPNTNLPSGYGKGEFTIYYDPVTRLGNMTFKISYQKLYSLGGLTPARVVGIEIRGPSCRCNLPANIVVNALAIYLLQTGGESPDAYVLGSVTLNKDKVQQFLHNLMYVVVRTQMFQTLPNREKVSTG